MRYQVTIIPGAHSGAFAEVAETIHYALLSLGHESSIGSDASVDAQHIILGTGIENHTLRPGSIIYNLEQVPSPWVTPAYVDMLRTYPAWDYSEANATAISRISSGVPRPRVVPIGYMPQMTRIPRLDPEIDVLFYGSINQRRADVLDELGRRGYKVARLFGVYGAARDAVISRSRLVVNIHYFGAKVFEAVRVSYLLANGVPVVSEKGACPAEEAPYSTAVSFVPYACLVDECIDLLNDPERREQMSEEGLRVMRSSNFPVDIQRALS